MTDSDIAIRKEKAYKFLSEVLSCFDKEYELEISSQASSIAALIKGEELSVFTDNDGKALEALRILTASVINDKTSEYVKFNIDAGGFRQKKDDKIRELALSIADKVKEEGESIKLPDMNSYDRRIAHIALQEDALIRTESEGEEPHRHLVVFPAS